MKTYRYCYKARVDGKLEEYSQTYESEFELVMWYATHGMWLEKRCGRELKFCKIKY